MPPTAPATHTTVPAVTPVSTAPSTAMLVGQSIEEKVLRVVVQLRARVCNVINLSLTAAVIVGRGSATRVTMPFCGAWIVA